jgi:hypothetical protein
MLTAPPEHRRPSCWHHGDLRLAVLISAGLLGGLGQVANGADAPPGGGHTYVVAQLHPAASDGNPGTAEKPFKTISRAVTDVKPGDTVLIETGVYRETVTIAANGTADRPIVVTAAPAANVVVTGADPVTDWQREAGEANVYSTAWPHLFLGWSKRRAHPDDDYHLTIGRVEQVFVDRYALLQVASRAELTRGTFFVDEPGKRLFIWDRTNQDLAAARQNVEAAVRQLVWKCEGQYVRTRGLCFRYGASPAQSGAVLVRGNHDVLEDCVIEQMNGAGLSLGGEDIVVRRCVIRDNGQMGFGAHVRDLLVTECVCENNNTKNVARGWEAGGNKLVLCKNAVLEKSIFRRNRGNGVWFDIGNEDCVVRNCLIIDNEDAGVFYEISYSLHAHDNVIVGNGLAPRFGAWGANAGISLSSSSRCVIERNLLVANKEGFQFREQGRSTVRLGHGDRQFAIWNHDHTVRNNVIAYNRDLQTGGWFDIPDAAHWPRALQRDKAQTELQPPGVLPPGTDLDGLEKRPTGMSLENLKLALTGNLYAVKPGQRTIQWGCSWRPHANYAAIEEVRQALALEADSCVKDIEFQDWCSLDLRVQADSPAVALKCYPQGEVPGVKLGIMGR